MTIFNTKKWKTKKGPSFYTKALLTRTLYENEKIYLSNYYMVNVPWNSSGMKLLL